MKDKQKDTMVEFEAERVLQRENRRIRLENDADDNLLDWRIPRWPVLIAVVVGAGFVIYLAQYEPMIASAIVILSFLWFKITTIEKRVAALIQLRRRDFESGSRGEPGDACNTEKPAGNERSS